MRENATDGSILFEVIHLQNDLRCHRNVVKRPKKREKKKKEKIAERQKNIPNHLSNVSPNDRIFFDKMIAFRHSEIVFQSFEFDDEDHKVCDVFMFIQCDQNEKSDYIRQRKILGKSPSSFALFASSFFGILYSK